VIDRNQINHIAPWPGAHSVAVVDSRREIGDSVATQRRYFVSSLPPSDPARIAGAIRTHWAIENGMHWTLDVAFDEDQSGIRVKSAAQNFAVLRRISINLLKQDTSSKVGIKTRRLKACADETYLAKLLGFSALPAP
jgi:predicted transposase YbfD/YdcC